MSKKGTTAIAPISKLIKFALFRSSIFEVISGNNAIQARTTSVNIVSYKQILIVK